MRFCGCSIVESWDDVGVFYNWLFEQLVVYSSLRGEGKGQTVVGGDLILSKCVWVGDR
jgi:hypothetical protein